MRVQSGVTLAGRLPTHRHGRTLDAMSVGAASATGATRGTRARREAAPFTPLPWKLQPPAVRPGTVPRTALVERMLAADGVPVVSITGPPGYGKTTLLAQWTERSPRPVASLLLDPADNDPAVLLAYLANALDRVEPIDVDACCARIPHGSSTAGTIAHRVLSALDAMSGPVRMALDHAESIRNPACRDAIDAIATHLPPGGAARGGGPRRDAARPRPAAVDGPAPRDRTPTTSPWTPRRPRRWSPPPAPRSGRSTSRCWSITPRGGRWASTSPRSPPATAGAATAPGPPSPATTG